MGTDYLRFEAESMLEFLKEKLNDNGNYTDQIYDGSNLSIILETLSALFEVFTYNLNFQATEATFNGVQIYENMLKICSVLGYKARATIAANILGTINGKIYIANALTKLASTVETIDEYCQILLADITKLQNSKILSKNLSFSNPGGTGNYVLLANSYVYPEFINLTQSNIFYYISSETTNAKNAILKYLRYIWSLPDLELTTTLEEVAEMVSEQTGESISTVELIQKYNPVPEGVDAIDVLWRVSSSDLDNYVTAVNGKWYTTFITDATSGERNEQFNIESLNVDDYNISDGTLYACAYDVNTIDTEGVKIYTAVSSLKNYSPSDKVFEYYVDVNRSISIKFGDGNYGAVLPENNSLALFFIVNDGEDGEVSLSSFEDGQAVLSTQSVTVLSSDTASGFDVNTLIEKFIYENYDVSSISYDNCILLSKLLSSENTDSKYIPTTDLYFTPLASSSSFQELETVDEIRESAPEYNRTNDRIITKTDLTTIIKREFGNYVYDLTVMNNYEYISKFYNWLYKYDSLSKDNVTTNYKYADACNFNDVVVWLKGYTTYNINDYIKNEIINELRSKKILTSEIVFCDSLKTYFYPYVGNISDDIDWLLYCREKYNFLIQAEDATDDFYVKYKTLDNLFLKKNGVIQMSPTKKMLNYIFSGESDEIKVDVIVYKDPNVNENATSIKTNVNSYINDVFDIENCSLGQTVKLNDLTADIANLSGVQKIVTNKYYNTNIYKEVGPVLDNISYVEGNTTTTVTFNENISYPEDDTVTQISWTFDDASLTDSGLVKDEAGGYAVYWEIMQLSTGNVESITPTESDDGSYGIYLNSTESGATDSILNSSTRSSIESSYAIYAKCIRLDENGDENEDLVCYTNKIKFTISALNTDGSAAKFKVSSYIDSYNNSTITFSDSDNTTSQTILSEPSWEITKQSSTLAFAKWTNDMVNAADFEYVSSGIVPIEDFCFPVLYSDISDIMTIANEDSTTFGITY